MRIIHADGERREINPIEGDILYTEGAVKVIIDNVARAVKNGKDIKGKEPMEWL